MAVKTFLYAVSLERLRALLGSKDAALRARLEQAWFGDKAIADKEREPDQRMMQTLVDDGELYGELDDETALRMDKMIMLLVERELGAQPLPFEPMRDDLQLLARALRADARSSEAAVLVDHLASGRRFDSSTLPIDVPHYAWLANAELRLLDTRAAEVAARARPKGVFGKLLGGGFKLTPEHAALLLDLRATVAHVAARGLDLFSVNRDPSARWDMA